MVGLENHGDKVSFKPKPFIRKSGFGLKVQSGLTQNT